MSHSNIAKAAVALIVASSAAQGATIDQCLGKIGEQLRTNVSNFTQDDSRHALEYHFCKLRNQRRAEGSSSGLSAEATYGLFSGAGDYRETKQRLDALTESECENIVNNATSESVRSALQQFMPSDGFRAIEACLQTNARGLHCSVRPSSDGSTVALYIDWIPPTASYGKFIMKEASVTNARIPGYSSMEYADYVSTDFSKPSGQALPTTLEIGTSYLFTVVDAAKPVTFNIRDAGGLSCTHSVQPLAPFDATITVTSKAVYETKRQIPWKAAIQKGHNEHSERNAFDCGQGAGHNGNYLVPFRFTRPDSQVGEHFIVGISDVRFLDGAPRCISQGATPALKNGGYSGLVGVHISTNCSPTQCSRLNEQGVPFEATLIERALEERVHAGSSVTYELGRNSAIEHRYELPATPAGTPSFDYTVTINPRRGGAPVTLTRAAPEARVAGLGQFRSMLGDNGTVLVRHMAEQ